MCCLPPLKEEERIYLNVSYKRRYFAQSARCGFDLERKLWFTGIHNQYINELIDLYGVNEEATSKNVLAMLKDREKGE